MGVRPINSVAEPGMWIFFRFIPRIKEGRVTKETGNVRVRQVNMAYYDTQAILSS